MTFSTFLSFFHSRMFLLPLAKHNVPDLRVFSDFLWKERNWANKSSLDLFLPITYVTPCRAPMVSRIPPFSTLTLTKYGIYPSIHIIWTNHENIALPLPFPIRIRYLPDAGQSAPLFHPKLWYLVAIRCKAGQVEGHSTDLQEKRPKLEFPIGEQLHEIWL